MADDCFPNTLDWYDTDDMAGSLDEPLDVIWVACDDRGSLPNGYRHHNGVNDIRRFSPT